MNVTLLNVGWITAPAGIWRQGEPMDRTIRFPIPEYLIETETERILRGYRDAGVTVLPGHDPAVIHPPRTRS